MNVSPEIMFVSEKMCNGIDFFHGVVCIIDDSGTQKKAKDSFLFLIFHKHAGNLFRLECTAAYVCFRTERAVSAIIYAGIGEKCLQQDGIPTLLKGNRINPSAVRSSPAML